MYGENCASCIVKVYIYRDDATGAVVELCRRRGDHAAFHEIATRLRGVFLPEGCTRSGVSRETFLDAGRLSGTTPSFPTEMPPPPPCDFVNFSGDSVAEQLESFAAIADLSGIPGCESEAASMLDRMVVEGGADVALKLQQSPHVQKALARFLKSNTFSVLYPAARLLAAFAKYGERGDILTPADLSEIVREKLEDPETRQPVKQQLAFAMRHASIDDGCIE